MKNFGRPLDFLNSIGIFGKALVYFQDSGLFSEKVWEFFIDPGIFPNIMKAIPGHFERLLIFGTTLESLKCS